MKRKLFATIIIFLISTMLLAGCGKSDDSDLRDRLEEARNEATEKTTEEGIEDVKADAVTEPEKEETKTEDSVLPRFYISKERDEKEVDGDFIGQYTYDQIHMESEDNVYKALEDELDRVNSDIAGQEQKAMKDDADEYKELHPEAKSDALYYGYYPLDEEWNICVRRADKDVMSFITEYSRTGYEGGYVEVRGHSYDMGSGRELKLKDIVKDEELFYDTLATELSYVVTRKMMTYTGENDMELIDCRESMEECIRDDRAGWVLDPQGITFWFENINAVLSNTTASVLFIDDADSAIFKEEYADNAPDEWVMQIPGHFVETKFDYGLDGSTDTIAWCPGEFDDDSNGTYQSGICVNYNAQYYDSADICPGDGLAWENYDAMLIYKEAKAVLMISHDEDIVSYIDTFNLKNDTASKADNMVGALAWVSSPTSYGVYVPTDPSAIEVHTVLDVESEEDAKPQYLSIDTDGTMTVKSTKDDVSEESGKKISDSEGSTGVSLTKDDAYEIARMVANGNICALEYHDYDGDGRNEAFAAIGKDDDMGGYILESIWFIGSDKKGKMMRDDFNGLSMYSNESGYYEPFVGGDDGGFFTGECGGYGSGWLSFIFGVMDGEPYELDLSMEIEGFYQEETGDFYTLTDDFTDGHRYLITELIYDSKTGQFRKGKVTDKDWAY